MKRLFALLLALAMVITCLPATAFAATVTDSGTCGDNVTWTLTDDGVLTISGEGAMYDYPNGFVDAPWGNYRMDITGIVISEGVTYVGQMAFEGCEGGVSSITIGSSVAAIGESAFFAACNGVTQLTIPASCTTIGSKAFYGCASLTDLVICGDNVTIGSQAFANGAFDSSMNIRFEGAAGSIDATAFESVTAAVSYPNDGTWDNVANQNYGGTLTWEAYTQGGGDEGGEEEQLPTTGSGQCGDSMSWNLDENGILTISGQGDMFDYVGGEAPWCACENSAIKAVVVEEGVTRIGNYAFHGRMSLASVQLPSTLVSIGDCAFGMCYALESIDLPEGLVSIGIGAFEDCSRLTNLTIPSTVTVLAEMAFNFCSGLMDITFLGDAPIIDDLSFQGVTATVRYPENMSGWDTAANQNYGGTLTWEAYTLGVGGATEIASGTCGDSLNWTLTDDGALTISGQGDMFDYAAGEAPWYGYASSIIQVFVNHEVTKVGDYAFYGCNAITQVYIPSTITAIGSNAFQGVTADAFYTDDCDTSLIGNYGGSLNWVLIPSEGSDGACSHQFEPVMGSDPSCISDGFVEYACVLCWDSSVTYRETISAWGHSFLNGFCEFCGQGEDYYDIAAGTCGDELWWSLKNDGTLIVDGTGDMYDYPMDDAPWNIDHRYDITNIFIAPGVTSVGQIAFMECENAAYVSLPRSLKTIGAGAFNRCAFTDVIIPESVTSIGAHAFFWQNTLKSVTIEGDGVTIDNCAFGNCGSLERVVFNGDAATIDGNAFQGVTATVLYPENNATWDSVKDQNYGGTLTWTAFVPGVCDGHVLGSVNGFDACLDGNGNLHICNNNFPDGNFRSFVADGFDSNSNGYLSASELRNIKEVCCQNMGLNTIEGIEFFGQLQQLNMETNFLVSVDLSGNPNLEYLNLRNNKLTAVDVTMLPELREVLFCMNQLTSLDLSGNPNLEQLSFPENRLTSIDLSNNPNIFWLVCYMNQLTSLDVTGLANLTWLDCDENQLTSLDVSKNTKLEALLCAGNQLNGLDITANTALLELHAANCGLTSLDITQNADLEVLRVNNNHGITITGINDACHEDLLVLDYGNCQITVDHSKMTGLQVLQCYANNLTSLDVSMLPDLRELTCSENMLKVLDLSQNANLERLHCANNYLVELDLSGNPNIYTLYCNNQYYDGTFPTVTTDPDYGYVVDMNSIVTGNVMSVESVDGSGAIYNVGTNEAYFQNDPSTTGFWYYYAINFAGDPDYTMKVGVGPVPHEDAGGIDGDGGQGGGMEADPFVPSADCPDSTSELLHICAHNFPDPRFLAYVQQYGGDWDGDGYLTRSEAGSVLTIACESWDIASLEGIRHFSQLWELYAMNNQLTSIDLSGNTELRHLHIGENHLTSLDVSMLPNLESLVYNNNQVGFVDLSNNPNLVDLHCINTGISSLDVSMLPNLQNLYCSDNDLTSLDLSNNPSLKDLGVDSNENLTTLTLAAGTSLRHIDYSHTGLTFDHTQHPDLEVLRCAGMGISSIDFSANTCLRELSLNENQLTSLDVSMLPDLETLDISSNAITSLDLSGNPGIKRLYIGQNLMNQLDLSACTALEEVHVENQFVQKSITWTQVNDSYEVDMHQFVDDVTKILRVDCTDSFDTATGIAIYGGEPEEVTYAYDTGWNGTELPVVVNPNCYHNWIRIDCTSRYCNWCGVVETGDFHNWQPATCTSLETCVECGLTQGTYEPHHYTQWVTTTAPTTTAAGERSRSCDWCGLVETQTIAQLADDGSVVMENVTNSNSNSLGATVDVSYNAVASGEAAGEYVSVALTARQMEDVDIDFTTLETVEESVNFIISGLDQSFSDAGKVYLDIDLIKQVGTNAPASVTETNAPVTVTITVPEELRADTMLYYIIRVHEGVAEVLPCTYDAAAGTLTFQTDRFSNYTLFWIDTQEESGGNTEETIELVLGEQGYSIPDNHVLYFTWTAPEEGDITFNMLSDSWLYAAMAEHTDGSSEVTDEYSSNDDEIVASTTLHVYEGSNVLLAITTSDFTAGELYFDAQFVAVPVEEPVVAVIGEVGYTSVWEALNAAVEGDTVTLVADSHEEDSVLVLFDGITLDLGVYDLYAKSLLGLTGSHLTGTEYRAATDYGRLFVPSASRLVLSGHVVNNDGSVGLLPVWDGGQGCYVMGGAFYNAGNYTLTTDESTISFMFAPSLRGDLRKGLFTDEGEMSDNGLAIVLRLTWHSGDGLAQQDFVYSSEFVSKFCKSGSGLFTFMLTGYEAMYIELEDLTITPMIVCDNGLTFCGQTVTGA